MTRQREDSVYWSPGIAALKAYVPGEQPDSPGWIKLNTNESPYPPSPAVIEAIQGAANDELRLYPDPEGRSLRAVIAAQFGLTPAHVFLGNGSDEVLAHAFPALLRHGRPVLFPDVTYSFYPVYAALYGVAYETVALDGQFEVDVAAYRRPNGGIVLANPNAPTGIGLPLNRVRELLDQNTGSVVILDEAYVDFGAQSAASLVAECPNLLVVQTLSKSRALAGLRAAFALGHPRLIEALERVKNSFNSYPLDRLALAGAEAAMKDVDHLRAITARVVASRQWLDQALVGLGFETLPSQANFLLVHHPSMDASALARHLRERRILVRHFSLPRIQQYLRISIGTQAECESLVQAVDAILRTEEPITAQQTS